MKMLFLHIIFICLAFSSKGQVEQLKQDLASSSASLKERLPAVIYSSYHLYATHDTSTIMSSTIGEVYLSNDSYYQAIESVHTFIQDGKVAVVDLDEKTIIVDRKIVDLEALLYNVDLENIHTYVESINFSNTRKTRSYDIQLSPYSSFERVRLSFSVETALLSNVTLYYAQSQGLENTLQEEETPRLEINIRTESMEGKTAYCLSNNPFFSISGFDVRLKSRYKDYSVINNLKTDE